ncbi:MAG TPA: diacylglycerol kinase family protein [Vicinamibacterales bacterium]
MGSRAAVRGVTAVLAFRPTFPMRAAVILNPVAGGAISREGLRRRADLALGRLRASGVESVVHATAYPGHGREIAARAVRDGCDIVVAWGGDGTVNEVAGALVHTTAALGIVPAGSGNGLARMLRMPADPASAIARIANGTTRPIDVGVIADRLFVNVAGVGFDAHVAALFAARAGARRGFVRYAGIVLRELRHYPGERYRVAFDGGPETEHRAFLLTFANGRQWGNGAVIAPDAQVDDGALDAVSVAKDGFWRAALAIPRLFAGTIDRARGVTITKVRAARVAADGPLVFHVDGEPVRGSDVLEVRVLPDALRIRC